MDDDKTPADRLAALLLPREPGEAPVHGAKQEADPPWQRLWLRAQGRQRVLRPEVGPGGDRCGQLEPEIDPIGGSGACAQVDDVDAPGTANYRIDVTQPFTLLGLPIVRANIDTTGAGGQIASRLWDIAPDGKQVLVARGVYRLEDDQKGTVTFQLFGNGYRFEAGHSAKLELLGRDAPYVRASNGRFSVKIKDLTTRAPGEREARHRAGGCSRCSATAVARCST